MEQTFVLLWMYGVQLLLIATLHRADGFGKSDRVLLEDVKTLTLHQGKMTAGRRSSPVQQMSCVGGSAGCSAFQPQVVQCYNRGSDGNDVQWECKTDMDNAYRFGKVEVTCEGYDHPDDPYVLAGSCGLEYTLDLTKEGMNQRKQQHNYYGSSGGSYGGHHGGHHDYYSSHSNRKRSSIGDWIMLAICGLIIYGIYKSCINNRHTGGTFPGDDPGRRGGNYWGGGGGGGNPPPPGFRPEYHPDSCSGTASSSGQAAGGGGLGGGNFWTGAAAGGLMGYLFGNRFGGGGGGYNRGYGRTGWGGGYGYSRPRTYRQPSYGSAFSGFGGGGGSSSSSTGTRTASGFGGTRRR